MLTYILIGIIILLLAVIAYFVWAARQAAKVIGSIAEGFFTAFWNR